MSADRGELAAAVSALLAAAGVEPSELAGLLGDMAGSSTELPTVDEAVASMVETNRYAKGTFRTYRTGWLLLSELYGDRRLDTLQPTDIERAMNISQQRALDRRGSFDETRLEKGRHPIGSDGSGAAENCLRAARALYKRAYVAAERPVDRSPAHRVDVPRRTPSRRRPLTRKECQEILNVAANGGDDPELDVLILRLAFETGARQEGIHTLRLERIDRARQTVKVIEKGRKERELPVSKDLLEALLAHAKERGGVDRVGAALWYRARGCTPPRPLTSRRFDTLFERIRKQVDWADQLTVSAHFIRHTIAKRMERTGGKSVTRRFLGHAESSRDTTDIYTSAVDTEVVRIWAQVMNEPHPLASEGEDW